jgi:hypothetical protein
MRNTLSAHELLCLRLQSFYEVNSFSPAGRGSTTKKTRRRLNAWRSARDLCHRFLRRSTR